MIRQQNSPVFRRLQIMHISINPKWTLLQRESSERNLSEFRTKIVCSLNSCDYCLELLCASAFENTTRNVDKNCDQLFGGDISNADPLPVFIHSETNERNVFEFGRCGHPHACKCDASHKQNNREAFRCGATVGPYTCLIV